MIYPAQVKAARDGDMIESIAVAKYIIKSLAQLKAQMEMLKLALAEHSAAYHGFKNQNISPFNERFSEILRPIQVGAENVRTQKPADICSDFLIGDNLRAEMGAAWWLASQTLAHAPTQSTKDTARLIIKAIKDLTTTLGKKLPEISSHGFGKRETMHILSKRQTPREEIVPPVDDIKGTSRLSQILSLIAGDFKQPKSPGRR